jgi:ABC-type lipoprotein export system ATPase subunit
MRALREVQRDTNTTVIIVTHDANVASQMDRLVTLVDGQIASDSEPEAAAQQAAVQVIKQKRATGELKPI